MLLCWWLLDERPRRSIVGSLVLTLTGVACVVGSRLGGGELRGGYWELAGVFSALCSGVAVTSIRAVRRPGADGTPAESSWTVFASFTALGLVAALPGVLGPLGTWVDPTPSEWGILLTVGLLSVGAQLTMTSVLEHVTAPTMGIVHQGTVVVTLICGVLFLGERLTAWSLAGSALTLGGVAWTMLVTTRPAPEDA
jgi:drug/metabolite transporter (DMT)-like permease